MNLSIGSWVLLLAAGLLAVQLFGCQGSSGKASVAEVKQLVDSGALLVDVRTPEEYGAGHIEGAVNIPLGELGARLKELGDPKQPVVVYCRSGNRSGQAARQLKAEGFTKVSDLGAMSRW